MQSILAKTSRHYRRLAAMGVTAVLALSGVTTTVVGVAHQQRPSEVPLSDVGLLSSVVLESSNRSALTPASASAVVGLILPASAPLALAIPAIGVDTPLLRLGLADDGSMQVPAPGPSYDYAGWYHHSPSPGSLGPAVIVGHVDSAKYGPSVFFRLGSLRPKDRVLVTRADGSVVVFAVDDVRRYQKKRFPTQLVYGDTNNAALRLITCGGPIDRNTGHYRDNIVVRASLVSAKYPSRSATIGLRAS